MAGKPHAHSCPLDTVGLASISPPILGSPPLEIDNDSVLLFLPPDLQPCCECRSFDDLIDDQTPIQRELGPCPFTPKIWDDKRKQIIRKYSTIYEKNADNRPMELSDFEVCMINEASYQLCLRDPTLLPRRDELLILAKRAITKGGYHDFSEAKNSPFGVSEKKHCFKVDESSLEGAKSLTPIANSTKKKRLSGIQRKQKMEEVDGQIHENKLCQDSKQAALKTALEQGDHDTAYRIKMELEDLEKDSRQLQEVDTDLKRRQMKSEAAKEKRQEEKQQHLNLESSPHHARSSAEQDCSSPSESNPTKQVTLGGEVVNVTTLHERTTVMTSQVKGMDLNKEVVQE